jgi:hypothetical protein
MEPIFVKIKKSTKPVLPPPNAINLNEFGEKNKKVQPFPKYLWLFLALLIIETTILIALFVIKPFSPYLKLFPKNLIAASYFKQSSLTELVKSLKNQNYAWPPFVWSNEALKGLAEKVKFEPAEKLPAIFDDSMVFLLLPASPVGGPASPVGGPASPLGGPASPLGGPASPINTSTSSSSPNWLAMATVKINNEQFDQLRDQAEKALKQNYNLIFEMYRQIKITQVKSLNQQQSTLYFAKINNYFFLTNNLESLKETIDKVIK